MSEPEARGSDRRSRPTRGWRIAHKLTAASTLMILLILVAGGVGLWQVLSIGQAIDNALEKEQQLVWSLEQEIRPANEGIELLIQQLVQQADRDVETTAMGVRTTVQRAVLLLGVVVVLTTAIAFGWRQFVFRGLGQSITELRQGAARISHGDLQHRLEIRTGDEVEELGDEFNKMADDLAYLVGSLEQRVLERTGDLEHRSVQLEAASQVAREAAAIRDVNRLLEEVVHLISDRFGFYHAGIFLVDEVGEYAVLRTASSEGGQRMLARGHALKVGKVGVVGYAAGRGEPRIALAVSADEYHYKNPDLPLTQSEVALPLKVRERVIGVLDVQSQEEMAFDAEDVAILQTLADQVALAIESARLLEESQRTLQELESLYGRRLRAAWQEREVGQTAYRYSRVGVTPAPRSNAPEVEDATAHGQPVVVQEGDENRLAVPISLRDQILGSVVLRREPGQDAWSPQELRMVEEVGTQIAMALEYARLLEDTQRRAARERLVGEITARMRETLDVDTVLRTAIREMGTALGIPRVEVRMATGGTRARLERE
jgi:nitrate/nitrite-specific signal transduction histidine kinase